MEKEKLLTIGTLNVKNIVSNKVYVRELLKSCDILAIQEHWLFTFQLADIENDFITHKAFSKAADEDEDDPLSPPPPPPQSEAQRIWRCLCVIS